MADLKRLSKFVSVLLRHNPDAFNLTLDDEGFAKLDPVWQAVKAKYGTRYSHQDLITLLDENPRYQIKNGYVRALYGHSAVTVTYPAVEPPETLYHGTVAAALIDIRKDGLQAMARQFVHLSTDTTRAEEVGGRRGRPVLLKIRAQAAYAAGHVFHHPEENHYLCRHIPPEFIIFP